MADETILLQVEDGIAEITFNRPEKRNAFDPAMYQRFVDVLRAVRADADVGVVLLSGQGKDFCAGNDLEQFAAKTDWDPSELADRTRTASTEIVHQLMECEKPIIAAVHGNAAGFGATMLLHCDVVVLDEAARLHYPFIRLGLVPEAGATMLCAAKMGYLRAFALFTQDRPIAASEALKLNLASQVVNEGSSHEVALHEATRLAALPREALHALKRLMRRESGSLSRHVSHEFEELAYRLAAFDR